MSGQKKRQWPFSAASVVLTEIDIVKITHRTNHISNLLIHLKNIQRFHAFNDNTFFKVLFLKFEEIALIVLIRGKRSYII